MLLNIEMMSLQPTLTGASRTVTHEVPVSIVPERLWADYQEPNMPDIDVSFFTFFCELSLSLSLSFFLSGEHISPSAEVAEEHNRQNEDNEQLCR